MWQNVAKAKTDPVVYRVILWPNVAKPKNDQVVRGLFCGQMWPISKLYFSLYFLYIFIYFLVDENTSTFGDHTTLQTIRSVLGLATFSHKTTL